MAEQSWAASRPVSTAWHALTRPAVATILHGLTIWIWHVRRRYGLSVMYLFITMIHTGALGALLTFAPAPLYPAYTGLAAWHLSALEDQQLAGLIMWVPSGAVYLGAALALAAGWLREAATRRPAAGQGAII